MPPPFQQTLDPRVATWLGTFISASIHLIVDSKHRSSPKRSESELVSGLKMFVASPVIGFVLWKWLSGGKVSSFSVLASSLLGAALLKTQQEVEAVNNVVWLRAASQAWAILGRRGVDFVAYWAIAIVFYGVVKHPQLSQKAIVKMTERFLSRDFFKSVRGEVIPGELEELRMKRGGVGEETGRVFVRTFKGLLAYNLGLHYAAAVISSLVRSFGSKNLKGAGPHALDWPKVFKQATKEAMILNLGVASSCAGWVAGTRLGGVPVGLLCAPVPVYFVAPRVRDTVFFIFLPWVTKFLFRVTDAESFLNPRFRLVSGVLLLEGPLRMLSQTHEESYAWMISVAFSLAQRLAGSVANF